MAQRQVEMPPYLAGVDNTRLGQLKCDVQGWTALGPTHAAVVDFQHGEASGDLGVDLLRVFCILDSLLVSLRLSDSFTMTGSRSFIFAS